MDQTRNEVYNVFVENENDLLGMIAYSLYKSEKIEKIEKVREQNKSEDQIQKNQ
jgi:hypothetical protein